MRVRKRNYAENYEHAQKIEGCAIIYSLKDICTRLLARRSLPSICGYYTTI